MRNERETPCGRKSERERERVTTSVPNCLSLFDPCTPIVRSGIVLGSMSPGHTALFDHVGKFEPCTKESPAALPIIAEGAFAYVLPSVVEESVRLHRCPRRTDGRLENVIPTLALLEVPPHRLRSVVAPRLLFSRKVNLIVSDFEEV